MGAELWPCKRDQALMSGGCFGGADGPPDFEAEARGPFAATMAIQPLRLQPSASQANEDRWPEIAAAVRNSRRWCSSTPATL